LATDYDNTASGPKFFDEYQAKKKALEKLMSDWEAVQFELDEISS